MAQRGGGATGLPQNSIVLFAWREKSEKSKFVAKSKEKEMNFN